MSKGHGVSGNTHLSSNAIIMRIKRIRKIKPIERIRIITLTSLIPTTALIIAAEVAGRSNSGLGKTM